LVIAGGTKLFALICATVKAAILTNVQECDARNA